MRHKHRILPGHIGGEYVEGNVIEVEVTACDQNTANHVMWHFANWTMWKRPEDLMAWRGLSGYFEKEEVIQERCRLGGLISGALMRDSGMLAEIGRKWGKVAMSPGGWLFENRAEYCRLGYASGIGKPENRLSSEELSKLAKKTYESGRGLASIPKEERVEISRRAGSASNKVNKKNKTGIYAIPPEEHSARMSNTNKQKWGCPKCEYTGIARCVNLHMKESHNLVKSSKIKL
jgi:hypothetical protein